MFWNMSLHSRKFNACTAEIHGSEYKYKNKAILNITFYAILYQDNDIKHAVTLKHE